MNDAKHQSTHIERSTLLVATSTAFMAPFMISALNVALPAIGNEFAANAVLLGWVATSYLLATALFLVPMGRLADLHGHKKVFNAGIMTFTLGSGLAIFSRSMTWLLAMRVVQGVGAAMFLTTGVAILTSVFPPSRRGWAIGMLVTAVYAGLAIGPFAGGLLTQFLGWRAIFALITFFGAASILIALRRLKGEWAEARGEHFDLPGSLMYMFSIFCLVYGGTRVPRASGMTLLCIGCAGLLLFFRTQQRTREPIFDVSLFYNNRTFLFSGLAALIHYAATFAVTFQISLFLQYIKGLSPQSAGTVLMIQPLMMTLFSAQAGKLSDRIEPRLIASIGMGLTALGLLSFVFLSPSTPLWRICLVLALLGFGFALFSSPNMSAIMGSVERSRYGLASGVVATMRLLGQMSSMTIATVFLALFVGGARITPETYPGLLAAIRGCFAFFAALCLCGIACSLARGNMRPNSA